jgi:hypothetical protein
MRKKLSLIVGNLCVHYAFFGKSAGAVRQGPDLGAKMGLKFQACHAVGENPSKPASACA